MTSVSTTNLATTKLGLAAKTDREKLSATAKQFEAIFVRQMLAAARKADLGGGDLTGGGALDTFREMQDNNFADIASQTGALGFAAKIEAQIARFLPSEQAKASAPKPGGTE
jgi:flagellar protein FlgJ